MCPVRDNVTVQECEKDLNDARDAINNLTNNNTDLQILLNDAKTKNDNMNNNIILCKQELSSVKYKLQECQDKVTDDTNCEKMLHDYKRKTCIGFFV